MRIPADLLTMAEMVAADHVRDRKTEAGRTELGEQTSDGSEPHDKLESARRQIAEDVSLSSLHSVASRVGIPRSALHDFIRPGGVVRPIARNLERIYAYIQHREDYLDPRVSNTRIWSDNLTGDGSRGGYLADLRELAGLTQAEAAALLGISVATLRRRELDDVDTPDLEISRTHNIYSRHRRAGANDALAFPPPPLLSLPRPLLGSKLRSALLVVRNFLGEAGADDLLLQFSARITSASELYLVRQAESTRRLPANVAVKELRVIANALWEILLIRSEALGVPAPDQAHRDAVLGDTFWNALEAFRGPFD